MSIKVIGFLLVAVAAAGAYFWTSEERTKLAAEKASLAQAEAALARESAERSERKVEAAVPRMEALVSTAQTETAALTGALETNRRLAEEQKQLSLRAGRVMEGLSMAQQVKLAMTEAYQNENRWPGSNTEAGLQSPLSYQTRSVHSLSVMPGGRLLVTIIDEPGRRETIWLTASVNAAGFASWRCTSPDITDIDKITPQCTYERS